MAFLRCTRVCFSMFVHATASSAVQSASLPHVDLDTPSPAGENHVEPEDPSDDPAVLEGDLSASRPNLPPTALTPVRCPLSLVQFCFRLELQGTVQALMSPIAAPAAVRTYGAVRESMAPKISDDPGPTAPRSFER